MKIIVTPKYYGPVLEMTVQELAEQALDNRLAEGTIEAIASRASNNSRAIGRLLTVLLERDIIGLDDVPEILATQAKLEVAP